MAFWTKHSVRFFYVHGLLWCTAFPFFRAYLSDKQELFIFPWPVSCPSEGSQKVNSKLALNYNQDSIWCGEAKNCIWLQKIGEDSFNSPVKGSHTGRVNLIFREKLNNFFNKFFPKSELMKGKGTYLSLSNLRQHKWNYMISKGELRFPNSSCEVMESPFRNHKMYTAGSEKFGWPTHIINSANKPNYMVLTFPPPPPRFPTDAALQFFRNTPLYSFGNN